MSIISRLFSSHDDARTSTPEPAAPAAEAQEVTIPIDVEAPPVKRTREIPVAEAEVESTPSSAPRALPPPPPPPPPPLLDPSSSRSELRRLASVPLRREEVLARLGVGETLVNADLREVDLAGADIAGADFAGALLAGAKLVGAHAAGTRFSGANLKGAHLEGAELEASDLTAARLADANLTRTDLRRSTLIDADLLRARLVQALLVRAKVRCARLSSADLRGADLRGADLSGADLAHADLRGADLSSAVLRGACLTGARVAGTVAVATVFDGAEAEWVDASPEGDGSARVAGEAALAELGRERAIEPVARDRRYFGPGDVLRNASLEFGDGALVEVDGRLEGCTLTLGPTTELVVGPTGVIAATRMTGGGRIVVNGQLLEDGGPAVSNARSFVVGASGAVAATVRQGETPTRFGFERGCQLRLKIAKVAGPGGSEDRTQVTRGGEHPIDPAATIIARGAHVTGGLCTDGAVVVRGRIEGELSASSVDLADTGSLAGRVQVRELRSRGELAGPVEADNVEIAGGRVRDGVAIQCAALIVPLADSPHPPTFGDCELHAGGDPRRTAASPEPQPPLPEAPADAEAGAGEGRKDEATANGESAEN